MTFFVFPKHVILKRENSSELHPIIPSLHSVDLTDGGGERRGRDDDGESGTILIIY
jgi:hypothetical protein